MKKEVDLITVSKKENWWTEAMKQGINWSSLWKKEDWWTVWLGFLLIIASIAGVVAVPVLPLRWGPGRQGAETIIGSIPAEILSGILVTGIINLALFSIGILFIKREELKKFIVAFPFVFMLAIVAELGGNYAPWRHYGFNSVIWALGIGLLVSNTIKTPGFMKGAVRTELYIKTGLVLLGASILFNRMLALGAMGLGVAWIVTPIVLISMYWFSQKVLKMHDSKGLAITIASATSVCGVSAAIAAGTAAKAKKEEISLAISITLIFTVVMMIGMPALVGALGIDPIVGGAWLGGTIDATGAVVAAGAMLGENALEVASVIKMVQNILIGLIAFGIAIFFSTVVEKKPASEVTIGPAEVWVRMPKFIIGFIAASILFSFILPQNAIDASLPSINGFREFLFTLAFISIGLESNFKEMAKMVKGGKPLTLYLVGQALNIILTFIAAYIFFSGRFFTLPF
ncbi:YeiH family protein [Alkaliphilus metalliredigens]|uniref:YeiH family protein n=1 Tax=Alkaliphilus metalliredigens TaxID=208226 RepID=UPI000315E857|nr:putative sulfate exporter family transporter [Alkaliphilus metalliredigens]